MRLAAPAVATRPETAPSGPIADRVISAGTDLGSVFAIAGLAHASGGCLQECVGRGVKPGDDGPSPGEHGDLFRAYRAPDHPSSL